MWSPGFAGLILRIKYFNKSYSSIKTSSWRIGLPFVHWKYRHGPATFSKGKFNWSYKDENNDTWIWMTYLYILLAAGAPIFNTTHTQFAGSSTIMTPCFSTFNISWMNISHVYVGKQQAQAWLPVWLCRPWRGWSPLQQLVNASEERRRNGC